MVSISKMGYDILDLSHPFKIAHELASAAFGLQVTPLSTSYVYDITSGSKISYYPSKRTQENLKLFGSLSHTTCVVQSSSIQFTVNIITCNPLDTFNW